MATSLFWTEGTAAESATAAVRALDAAIEQPSVTLVEGALEHLVRYHERRAVEGGGGEGGNDKHRSFLQRVTEALTAVRRQVVSFVFQTSTRAEAGRDDEQLAVSWRRSAIQVLLDDHASVLEALDPGGRAQVHELVALIDEELRRMGTSYGRLPDEDLPRGLPRSHWWWWPEPKPDYQRWQGWDEPP